MKPLFLIAIYLSTFAAACLWMLSDGSAIERMIISDLPYARSQEERDRITAVATATRMGVDSSPTIAYIITIKASIQCLATWATFYILTTIALLFYSEINGSLQRYALAFTTSLWILSIANLFNPILKLLLSRISASISFVLFFRPFDWNNVWQIFLGKMDIFFIAYLVFTAISCAAVAKIKKSEAIMLLSVIWLAMYFMGVVFGLDPTMSF